MNELTQESISLKRISLKFGSYNLRGIKRIGRQCELSHLLAENHFDILGVQETKCSGNTATPLANGFLFNSSHENLPNRPEHRGTGIIITKELAKSIRKTYQGSSRWCGLVLLATPVPLLILSVYAPTAAAETEDKQNFYQEIGEIIAENGGAFLIILGDFNAQILSDPGLPRHIGRNLFSTHRPLGEQSADVLENRDLFLDFLLQYDLTALNTLHEAPPEKQVTYRHPGQTHFEPPWSENCYAQIDYILTKARWKSHFAAVNTLPQFNYDSDHLPLQAVLHLKWKFGSPVPTTKRERHRRICEEEEVRKYNNAIAQSALQWHTLQDTIKQAALTHRGRQPPQLKLPYLQPQTIELLRARDDALAKGNQQEAKILTAQFRRRVKRDRKQHQAEQLQTFIGSQQNWPAIKQLRTVFTPRFSKRGHTKANIPTNFPNDCAIYFAQTHWAPIPTETTTEKRPLYPKITDEGPFTKGELDAAIDGLRRNKAGGPDDLITELFKDMNDANRDRILDLYNEIYQTEEIPAHFNEAHVVQIYKPGKPPTEYSSYRPIALLNITYKILAKMIQERLRQSLDDRIVPFQYGYRRGKSTAEPIFIARRTQDLAERNGKPPIHVGTRLFQSF